MLRELKHSFVALLLHFRRGDSGVLIVRAALLAVALLLCIGVAAQSQQSPQTPKVKAEQKAEGSAKDQSEANWPIEKASPASSANTDKANTNTSTAYGGEEGTEFWPPFFGMRVKITDSLLVLFTSILAIFTGTLWGATKALVQEAENTAYMQLRAYVFVDYTRMEYTGPLLPKITILLRNFGQTPAYEVEHTGVAYIQDVATKVRMMEHEVKLHKIDVAPHAPIVRMYPFLKPLEQVMADAIVKGEKLLYVSGRVNYVDAFRKNQTTDYKFVYGGPESAFTPDILRPCQDGNKAT